MTKKKVRSITIIGHRWFDKKWGNTYCSSTVLVNGVVIGRTGPEYGYGDYYVQSASDLLDRLQVIKRKKYQDGQKEPLWQFCQDNGIAYYASASDVRTRKDL